MVEAAVLLHGFTNTGASWDPVVTALGESYRALAPDIRGHGSAADVMPVTLDAVVGDLVALAPPRFTLAGYSMGGRIALHVALAMPMQVQRLVLIGASPGLEDPDDRVARREQDEQLADAIEGMSITEFAERWARTPVLAGAPPEVARRAHADRLRSTPAGLARALRGLGTGTLEPVWARLGELDLPVILVVGEHDEKFRAIAAAMADELPQARIVVAADCGHAVHLEAPDLVAEVIAARRAA
jgi:2-succinyl-6-hydroxy-2,4-cyclohexadiene-1-carboxylate synthase